MYKNLPSPAWPICANPGAVLLSSPAPSRFPLIHFPMDAISLLLYFRSTTRRPGCRCCQRPRRSSWHRPPCGPQLGSAAGTASRSAWWLGGENCQGEKPGAFKSHKHTQNTYRLSIRGPVLGVLRELCFRKMFKGMSLTRQRETGCVFPTPKPSISSTNRTLQSTKVLKRAFAIMQAPAILPVMPRLKQSTPTLWSG